MENLKIRVANEAESKEIQGLFFELGCGWHCGRRRDFRNLDKPYLYLDQKLKDITYIECGDIFNDKDRFKEITLPQLRDMVVLKRNDVNDATHTDGEHLFYVGANESYFYSDCHNYWRKTWKDTNTLKPIQEKQVETKLFLDPKQNYAEIEWDGTTLKGDDWVEVPDGVSWAYKNTRGKLIFMDGDIGESFKRDLVWQRTQDELFLTPESLCGTINPKPDFTEQGAIVSDGGSTNYYKKEIPALVLERWKKTGIIEAEDVIRLFLGNDFTQGNNFKAGVRLISAQQGKGKAGINQMYDLNKQEWFVASAKKAFIEFD